MSMTPERARGGQNPDFSLTPGIPKGMRWDPSVEPPVRAFYADGLKQTFKTDGASSKAAGFSISGFLSGFKTGDVVDIDGPMWADGTGRIQRLDNDWFKLSYNVKTQGQGTIEVSRVGGNRYLVKLGSDSIVAKYHWDGKQVVLTDETNASRKILFKKTGDGFNVDPIGFGCPGDFDIKLRK